MSAASLLSSRTSSAPRLRARSQRLNSRCAGSAIRPTTELLSKSLSETREQVARIVETLVTAAQREAGATPGTADAYAVATGAIEGVVGLAGERRSHSAPASPSAPLRLGVDGDLAERVLHPVVENACRYGRSWARITVTRHDSAIVYLVEDDGPGVSTQELETIFEPGIRGLAGRNGTDSNGAGLGLALARRLARAASGDIVAEPADRRPLPHFASLRLTTD